MLKEDLPDVLLGMLIAALFIYTLYPFLDVFIYAIFLYYVARPIYSRFQKHSKSATVSAAATIFLVVIPITVMTLYTIAVASIDTVSFLSSVDIPYVDDVVAIVGDYSEIVQSFEPGDIYAILRDARVKSLWSTFSNLFWSLIDLLFRLFMVFAITFYLLIDIKRLEKYVLRFFSKNKSRQVKKFFRQMDEDLSNVFQGNIMTAVITGFIGLVLFVMMNTVTDKSGLAIPYPIMLGLMCGVTSLVPVIGVALVWLPVGVYLLVQLYLSGQGGLLWLFPPFYMLTTFVVVDWLPNVLVRPKLSGGRIHAGLMMFAYIFGSIVFGFKGLFLGPMILVALVDYVQIILPSISKFND